MTTETYRSRILGDPFAAEPLPKAYYYPSPERKLTKGEKSLAISPSRQVALQDGKQGIPNDRLSPMDEIFLQGSNNYRTKTTEPVEEELDESWPTSERPSSISLTGLEDLSPGPVGYRETVNKFNDLKQKLAFPEHDSPDSSPLKPDMKTGTKEGKLRQGRVTVTVPDKDPMIVAKRSRIPQSYVNSKRTSGQQRKDIPTTKGRDGEVVSDSVLQKYIERFRNSEPMSREERTKQTGTGSKDFWWLSTSPPTPSDSSTPIDEKTGGKKSKRFTPLSTENLAKYDQQSCQLLSKQKWQKDLVLPSPGDRKTRELQERAERLLEKSNSSVVSTDPAVSTEGLGSNASSQSDMSGIEDYPVRPKFAYFADIPDGRKPEGPSTYRAPPARPTSSEDDILQQWRLKRRMDQARETAPKHVPTFNFLSKTEQQKKIEDKLEEFKRKLAGKESTTSTPRTNTSDFTFTPAPRLVRESRQPSDQLASNQPEPVQTRSDVSEPVIASPTLHRKKSLTDTSSGVEPVSEVNPHLHLMCDLLPCPHQGQYLQKFSNLRISSEGLTGDEDIDKAKSDKTKYKQFLEAEKPDVEKTESEESVRSYRNAEMKSVGKEDVIKVDSEIDKIQSKHKRKQKEDIRSEKEPCIGQSSNQTVKCREQSDHRRVKSQGQERSEAKGQSIDSSIPRPKPASSPKLERRQVEDTIGQVVKDRLFKMSTSTLISSVDSLPPVASLDQSQTHHQRAPSPKIQPETDEVYESDGEFEDDQLLRMLRQQRSQYEKQLMEIDQQLDALAER